MRRGSEPATANAGVSRALLVFWTRYLPPLIVALGGALRFRQFLSNRSQWLDEIQLSNDVIATGYAHLFGALGSKQVTPPGYLLVAHTFVKIFGSSDYVLRLLPFIAGLVSLIVFWWLARRVLSPWARPVALLLFATAPALIYYSGEAKQYGVEQFATLVIAATTLWLFRGEITLGRAVSWGVVCAVAIWFSYTGVFVVAAAGATACCLVAWRRQWRQLLHVCAGGVISAASFAAVFRIQLNQVGPDDSAVHGFWTTRHMFAPQPVRLDTTLSWLPLVLRRAADNPLGSTAGVLVAVLLVLGLAALLVPRAVSSHRQRALLAGIGLGTFVIAVSAAVLDRYPLGLRLAVYGMPLLFLVAAAAIDVSAPRWAYLGIIPALLLLLAFDRSIGTGLTRLVHPERKEESKPVLAYVARHREPGDLILVHRDSDAAMGYYGHRLGLTTFATFFLEPRAGCDDAAQLAPVRRARRFWIVITHADSGEPRDAVPQWVAQFATVAHVVDAVRATGAHAYLFVANPPDQPGRIAPRWPHGCVTLHAVSSAASQLADHTT